MFLILIRLSDLILAIKTNLTNQVGGTLHWAPEVVLDAFYRTSGVRYLKRSDYSDAFHTYGMEWSENYIYTWVDTRLAVRYPQPAHGQILTDTSNQCIFHSVRGTAICMSEVSSLG